MILLIANIRLSPVFKCLSQFESDRQAVKIRISLCSVIRIESIRDSSYTGPLQAQRLFITTVDRLSLGYSF